ncbi:uncharacterized protein LOC143228394 [Tachypleus tridentatus]|uniref:uncharacterized protein LOC143228394 n=1 Tax=Tachypleus tridentatus TaxID=6853 RepID=UPI003FD43EB4
MGSTPWPPIYRNSRPKQSVRVGPLNHQDHLPPFTSHHAQRKKITVERVKLEKHKEQHLETNFIKRNFELVRDACGFFSSTIQENQRLDQLLQDWTAEDLRDCSESEAILQLSVPLEEGFVHTQEEQNTLESIEDKLKCLRQNDYQKTEEKFNSAQDRLQEQDLHHRMNSINVELEKLNGNSKYSGGLWRVCYDWLVYPVDSASSNHGLLTSYKALRSILVKTDTNEKCKNVIYENICSRNTTLDTEEEDSRQNKT